jgi:hypothetical protein
MKIATIVLSIVLFLVCCSFTYIHYQDGKQIDALNMQVAKMQSDMVSKNEMIDNLSVMAYPKTFISEKTLDKWLKTTKDKSKYEYYSESAVELVKEARDAGYFMGIIPVKLTYDAYGNAKSLEVPMSGGGNIMCVTVVDGNVVYLVDPATLFYFKTTTMQAELKLNEVDLKNLKYY